MNFNPESAYQLAADKSREKAILKEFSPEQQVEIEEKLKRLSLIPKFIGQDFDMPVELNAPDDGWHWDFAHNVVRVDPLDILEKPMDYLRFVMAHEGGHRRVSRTDFIPKEVWNQQGFSFMMNAIEDPRMNNFVADVDPIFKEHMKLAYQLDLGFEVEQKKEAQKKLGFQPRFMQVGLEYIKQWFNEVQGKEFEMSNDLPLEVQNVVEVTLHDAQDSWWRYPSRQEADSSEDKIVAYAKKSYEINKEKIWPLFKKLVEQDVEDQKVQEFLQQQLDQQQNSDQSNEGQGGPQAEQGGKEAIPQNLKDQLTEEEEKELEEALEEATQQNNEKKSQSENDAKDSDQEISDGKDSGNGEVQGRDDAGEESSQESKNKQVQSQDSSGDDAQERGENEPNDNQGQGKPVDLDSFSESLKQKIQDFISSLPQDQKDNLQKKAEEKIKEFEKELNESLENKLKEDSKENKKLEEAFKDIEKEKRDKNKPAEQFESHNLENDIRSVIERSKSTYDKYYEEVAPLINQLTNDLRNIFRERKKMQVDSGFKRGKSINISKRIREVASDVSQYNTRAFEKKKLPIEKDYAISLLVDLSGSMQGEKIEETLKATIILAEVLNRLSIKTEVTGFNDRLHEFQNYGDRFTNDIRETMGSMLQEVRSNRAAYNDDGWALQQISKRLGQQNATQKFIIALSDGKPAESSAHSGDEFDLHTSVKKIMKDTDQKLIGLGLLSEDVADYYPHNISNIDVQEMTNQLASLIRSIIENPTQY